MKNRFILIIGASLVFLLGCGDPLRSLAPSSRNGSGSGVSLDLASLGILPSGVYRVPDGGIYYSNSKSACYFASWNDFLLGGFAPDLSGVNHISAFPTDMPIDGPCWVPTPAAEAPTNSVATANLSFQVSAPMAVIWPSGVTANLPVPQIPDSLFTVLPIGGQLIAYVADQYTYPMIGSSLLEMNIANSFHSTPALGPGPQGQFDECGAWIHGADQSLDGSIVRGWYHAESGYCHGEGANQHPVKWIAYSESRDGGRTFSKPGYPGNAVLTGPADELAQASSTVTGGNGDFSIVRRGSFNYMFFLNAFTGRSGVAVANLHTGGPGSWLKWYRGNFSEPGLGGRTSNLSLALGGVSLNTSMDRFVGVTYDSGAGGFNLALSPNSTEWTVVDTPLVPGGVRWGDMDWANWIAPHGYGQYPSIVAPDGTKNWTDRFYLYYMYIRPGDSFQNRFLVVSQVTMSVNSGPVSGPRVSTSLERYYSPAARKHWITSGLPVPLEGAWDFQHEARLGSVFTAGGSGLIALQDCLYGQSSYLVAAGDTCESGQTRLRTIGWIFAPWSPRPSNTHAIYRCYWADGDDHFVSLDPNCENAAVRPEGLLGYVLD